MSTSLSIVSNLSLSNKIDTSIDCSIIPVLLTHLQNETLFKYLSKYIHIPESYTQLLENLEENMKTNNLGMASLTFEYPTIYNNNNNNTNNNTNTMNKPSPSQKRSLSKKKKSSKQKKLSKKYTRISTKSKSSLQIHRLFIIPINNKSYNKSNDDELLELSRISGNAIYNRLKNNKISRVNIIDTLDTISGESTFFIEAIMEGLLLSSYRFLKYKTEESLTKKKDKFKIEKIHLVLPLYKRELHKNKTITTIKYLINKIKSVFLTRDLINEPANDGKAQLFIDIVRNYIKENHIPVTLKVIEKDELKKMGMGLILGVGKASTKINEPRLLILKYEGNRNCKSKSKSSPDYVLLGKGITFDTGGTDLKKASSMYDMKTDMSGAATVISFLLGYAMNHGSRPIYSMCPLVENSIGSGGIKPSDVLTSYGGKTVEVSNTDAEGRLVLADCLGYVCDTYPNAAIIDFATLTGQQESLSCKMFSNILGANSDDDIKKLIAKGKHMNEPLVELPIIDKHLNKLESYVADIKNSSFSCSADLIMSSLFMKQFINKSTRWIHIDIAGTSYKLNEIIKYASPEASGVGVRLLFDFFDKN
jgi:leucyl aminopeptidase